MKNSDPKARSQMLNPARSLGNFYMSYVRKCLKVA